MEHASPFVPLLLITVLAVVVPLIVSRIRPIRLPIAVGEIVAGIIIGKSGFNLVQPLPTLDFLAEFGFVFLMFLSGLEVNLDALFVENEADASRPAWQRPVPLATLSFLLTLLIAVGFGSLFAAFGLTRNAILMGLILSTTSLGIVVPVLKERELTATIYGQTVLVLALLSDFVTLLLLSLDIAILSRGFSLDILLFMLLLVLFASSVTLGQWTSRIPVLRRGWQELSHATAQIPVRGAFALMITWVVLAQGFGVEVILGAFLAGAIISISSPRHESPLREKLDAIGYGFFIPIFFIMVGANFDLRALLASPSAMLLVPLLIIVAYAVKIFPAMLLRMLFSWRETLAAGVLMSSRLSLIIATSAIALNLNLISDATNAAIILVAVVTCTLSPILFGRILPTKEKEHRYGVIILGTNQLVQLLGARLNRSEESVTFIGSDHQQLTDLHQDGFRVVTGRPADAMVLEKACASRSRALVVLSNSYEEGLAVCRIARERFGIPTIIARVDDPQYINEFQKLDVQVIQSALATVLAIEGALHFPIVFSILQNKNNDIDLIDLPLRNRSLHGRSLRRMRLPGNALIIGIRRDGEVVVPHGDTTLQFGDTLMLVGSAEALREARNWLV
jgi:Kef-type K+ transport system membrane component KefB/Trk K+ transport system NAD-binding subunit